MSLADYAAKSYEIQLRGRHYPSTEARPSTLLVGTRGSAVDRNIPRFPLAESHFADARIQPYIHDCSVIVLENSQVHHLIVFFKNHRHLPPNRSLAGMDLPDDFRGDLLVMRSAARNVSSFVNMRGRDTEIADFAVKQCVFSLLVPHLL